MTAECGVNNLVKVSYVIVKEDIIELQHYLKIVAGQVEAQADEIGQLRQLTDAILAKRAPPLLV